MSSFSIWLGPSLVNEGAIPQDQTQQKALYHQLLDLCPVWCWTDTDGDTITIASLNDLQEAFRDQIGTEPGEDQLHLHATQHHAALARRVFCTAAHAHARAGEDEYSQALRAPLKESIVEQIGRDMSRTWVIPNLPDGKDSLILSQAERVLRAFASARGEIGYCQGMNSVAVALLLLVQSRQNVPATSETSGEAQAFALLLHWADSLLPPAFWSDTGGLHLESLAAVHCAGTVMEKILLHRQPSLAAQLSAQLPMVVVASRLLPSLFVGKVPLETAFCIWDQLSVHGAPFLSVAAAALVELALLSVVEAGGELELETIFNEMDRFCESCCDTQQLLSVCTDSAKSPSIEQVTSWTTQTMMDQMAYQHDWSMMSVVDWGDNNQMDPLHKAQDPTHIHLYIAACSQESNIANGSRAKVAQIAEYMIA